MNRETILVVDDAPQITELLAQHFLPQLGYETLVAYDGKTALEIVRRQRPDLMLLDLQLPDITGLDVLRQLASEDLSISTIFVTAYGSERVAVEALRLGVQDYLTKPVDLDLLKVVIAHALTQNRLRRERARLTARLNQQVTQLTVLSKVGRSVTSILKLDEVLRRIVEAGVYLTKAEEGLLALLDKGSDQLYLRATKNLNQDEIETLHLKISDPLLGSVVRTGRPLCMSLASGGQPIKLSTGFLMQSLLLVPLRSKGQILGVLLVGNRVSDQDFSKTDETLLASLADYAAVAIENARLYTETGQQLEELEMLVEAGQMVLSTLALNERLMHILKGIVARMGIQAGFILLLDEQTDELVFEAVVGPKANKVGGLRLSSGRGVAGQVARQGESLLIPDVRQLSEFDRSIDELIGLVVRSLICVPLQVQGQVIGVIEVLNKESGHFDRADLRLLEMMARFASLAIENARLYEAERTRRRIANTLQEMSQIIGSTLQLDQVLRLILEELEKVLDFHAAVLLLVDEARDELYIREWKGHPEDVEELHLPLSGEQGIATYVARTGQPLHVPDKAEDERYVDSDLSGGAVLAAPLKVKGKVIGVLSAESEMPNAYDADDLDLLAAFANHAAIAIDNARLYDEATRRAAEATAYARELESLHQQERQLRESLSRLRSTFLNAIGHELTTPITVMIQSLETLVDPRHGTLNEGQKEIVETLHQQTAHLQHMIGGLVSFAGFAAKQDDLNFRPTSLDVVLDDALQLVLFKAQRREVQLEDRRPDNLPVLAVDEKRLSEALVNLLDNAIRVSPSSTSVILSGAVHSNKVEISVQDFGPGIPEEEKIHIWDGLIQINRSLQRGLEGLGLGLAMTRYIVEMHGGTVSLESVQGRGSTFTIALPRKRKVTGMLPPLLEE